MPADGLGRGARTDASCRDPGGDTGALPGCNRKIAAMLAGDQHASRLLSHNTSPTTGMAPGTVASLPMTTEVSRQKRYPETTRDRAIDRLDTIRPSTATAMNRRECCFRTADAQATAIEVPSIPCRRALMSTAARTVSTDRNAFSQVSATTRTPSLLRGESDRQDG
jgi:hypothetical protein